nr:SMI1/KNR4 family protein [Stenotrophomonas sp. 169]
MPVKQEMPDDEILDAYQEEMQVEFTNDFRFFLKEASDSIYNGKDALVVTASRKSSRELIVEARSAWEAGLPRGNIPFCGDNGNYYYISKHGGVGYWSHDGVSGETWPNRATWIEEVWIGGG